VHHLNLALDGKGGFEIKHLRDSLDNRTGSNAAQPKHNTVPAVRHCMLCELCQQDDGSHEVCETCQQLISDNSMSVDEHKATTNIIDCAGPSSLRYTNESAASETVAPCSQTPRSRQWLLRLLFGPSALFGAEGGRMLLLAGAIVFRTYLSDRIAHLNGEALRHIISQDQRQFMRLLGRSLFQAASQAVLAPSILSLAEAVALAWRARLTKYITELYFKHRGCEYDMICDAVHFSEL
jgi:hypothetical protein